MLLRPCAFRPHGDDDADKGGSFFTADKPERKQPDWVTSFSSATPAGGTDMAQARVARNLHPNNPASVATFTRTAPPSREQDSN
jgi:hypothetical protein